MLTLGFFHRGKALCFSKANSSLSPEQEQDVKNTSHSVDILGSGH